MDHKKLAVSPQRHRRHPPLIGKGFFGIAVTPAPQKNPEKTAEKEWHMPDRRFLPPWSVDDPDTELGQTCYIVRDANGHALAYVYFENEPGRRIGGPATRRGA
jgi:hypothetical protein